ncbi:unannotated protein [freshwater metagenome]|uniref:Unannotated protein n=1 Tax=freshwater metagenome TaxID=449393 RepID=A0A6J7A9A3_9ZZZZ
MIERRGIPAMLIGTDRFRSVLEATRRMTGVPDVRWAEVPHPLGSLVAPELRDRARLAIDQFESIVLGR